MIELPLRRTLCACATFLALLGPSPLRGAVEPDPSDDLGLDDFAVGRPLVGERAGGVHSVLLDYGVYRRSVEPGLADLRVFDAEGRPVPYAIRRPVRSTQSSSQWVEVPIFPLDSPTSGEGAAGVAPAAGEYRIDAELSASGAILSIHRDAPQDNAPGGPDAWLLDASAVRGRVVGLRFEIEPGEENMIRPVRLESSEDLSSFKDVGAEVVLARLAHDGHRIERSTFDIPATGARYLRVSSTERGSAARPVAVKVRRAGSTSPPPVERLEVAGRYDAEDPTVVRYVIDARLPVESVQVRLRERDSIVEGRLESAASAEGPWRLQQSSIFYYFERAGELRNAPLSPRPSTHRYWRFVTSKRGGGLRGDPPPLEIEWRPEELLFVARGSPVSTLAIGRAGASDGSFAAKDLLRSQGLRSKGARLPAARLGAERELAGSAVLEAPPPPVPWRTYGLWALLLASVAVVLGLGVALLRSASD